MTAPPVLRLLPALALVAGCASTPPATPNMSTPDGRTPVLIDTDANNELDDQHALAYALFSADALDVVGITVNRTNNGGGIAEQVREARRITALAGSDVPVVAGADGGYDEVVGDLDRPDFDGAAAVDFIVRQAHAERAGRLVLLPVGKLTNVALALAKDPTIASKVRVVWLGSNYPAPGEYNQDNDEAAVNAVLDADVPFEIVLVRYGEPSGTDAVKVTLAEVRRRMPGMGPRAAEPVEGRNGGTFTTFGDYSVNLFENIDLYGDPPARALFDMAAVAIVKDPSWATARRVPAPHLVDGAWVERPDNAREVTLWEDFDRDAIMEDFFDVMRSPVLAE